jgi:hypothetical protein
MFSDQTKTRKTFNNNKTLSSATRTAPGEVGEQSNYVYTLKFASNLDEIEEKYPEITDYIKRIRSDMLSAR